MTTAPPSSPSRAGPRLPIDPRIRERRIAVRRAEGRRRLKFLGAVLAITGLSASGLGIAHSSLLAVHHVEVSGSTHTSRQKVVAAAGLDPGTLMIHVQPGRMAERLMALPWVDSASVHRRWPNTVGIQLTERLPVALIPAGTGQMAMVDGTGRVLAIAPPGPAGPGLSLPVVNGLLPAGPPGSSIADGQAGRDALALVEALHRSLPPAAAPRVTTVTESGGQLTLTVGTAVAVRLGAADQLDAKVLALRTILDAVDLNGVSTIDLRVPDVPVLTRPNKPSTVSTTPRG